MREKRYFKGEPHARCKTREDFELWCRDAGWNDASHFETDTGVTFGELRGLWFTVVHNQVFFRGRGRSRPQD